MTESVDIRPTKPLHEPSLIERPAFQLIYLPFYFVPWIFVRPGLDDIAVAIVAILVFVPLYFRAYANDKSYALWYAAAIEGIMLAIGPFWGMNGSYHIYANSVAGFAKNWRHAAAFIILGTALYVASGFVLFDRHWVELGLTSFMSIIVGLICIGGRRSMTEAAARERELQLDRKLAALEERERIARDLHDILGHTLTMVAVKSDLAGKLVDADPYRAKAEITDIRDQARTALKDVRAMVSGITDITLTAELRRARQSLEAAGIAFYVLGDIPDLDPDVDKAISLAIREAVTNAIRHSGAEEVRLSIASEEGGLRFEIEDNGSASSIEPGAGLKGLMRRIEGFGGKVSISAEAGAKLNVFLPVEGAAPA